MFVGAFHNQSVNVPNLSVKYNVRAHVSHITGSKNVTMYYNQLFPEPMTILCKCLAPPVVIVCDSSTLFLTPCHLMAIEAQVTPTTSSVILFFCYQTLRFRLSSQHLT